MCASVSRTEEKLEPIGLVNCSDVSLSAAASERRLAQALYSNNWRISSGDIFQPSKLKRAVLCKCEAGQCRTCGSFGNFHPDRWRIGSIHLCRAKHRILSKHFVVELGNQIILAIFVFAPDLPKLDGLNCHAEFLQNPRIEVTVVSSRVTAALVGVNAPK